MKNVKVFIGFLIVVMATLFIYACAKDGTDKKADNVSQNLQTETRTAEPCENALGNCNGVAWTPATATNISIALYPGCTFEVAYRYKICPDGKFEVIIDQFSDWPPCAAFNADILTDPFIISKVEKQIMFQVVNILLQNPLVIIPPCGSGLNVSFGFSTSSCINFCIVALGPQQTPNGEIIKVAYVKIPCGEACCKTTYEVCMGSNGKPNSTVSVSQGTGNCSSQSPNLPCPINSIGSTGCIPNCYLL